MPVVENGGAGPSRCGGWIASGQLLATQGRLNFTAAGLGLPANSARRSKATAPAKVGVDGKSRSER